LSAKKISKKVKNKNFSRIFEYKYVVLEFFTVLYFLEKGKSKPKFGISHFFKFCSLKKSYFCHYASKEEAIKSKKLNESLFIF
jgi:hypothetical protein